MFDISKIQIQKQITTQDNPDKYTRLVCLIFQRYKFKSKSQLKRNSTHLIAGVFDISKIQIQKQITTTVKFNQNTFTVCLIFQRYKFKSKSQQRIQLIGDQIGVFDISKIQIQKQITTSAAPHLKNFKVCLIFQRYKFKSKSQLCRRYYIVFIRCV